MTETGYFELDYPHQNLATGYFEDKTIKVHLNIIPTCSVSEEGHQMAEHGQRQ